MKSLLSMFPDLCWKVYQIVLKMALNGQTKQKINDKKYIIHVG